MLKKSRCDLGAAIAACDDVVDRFGESTDAALQAQVALALVNKNFIFGQQSDADAAMALYEDVVSRYDQWCRRYSVRSEFTGS